MSSSRRAIALSDAEVADFVAAGRTLVLATLGPDGAPDPVPMWYVVDDAGAVLMRVDALIESGERYAELRGVQLSGSIELVEDDDLVADVMVALLQKYEGLADEHVVAARAALQRAPMQAAMRLYVDSVASWDHRKLSS